MPCTRTGLLLRSIPAGDGQRSAWQLPQGTSTPLLSRDEPRNRASLEFLPWHHQAPEAGGPVTAGEGRDPQAGVGFQEQAFVTLEGTAGQRSPLMDGAEAAAAAAELPKKRTKTVPAPQPLAEDRLPTQWQQHSRKKFSQAAGNFAALATVITVVVRGNRGSA